MDEKKSWTEIRADCTDSIQFGMLKEQVRRDVQHLVARGYHLTLKDIDSDSDGFLVVNGNPHRNVVFELTERGYGPITVTTNTRTPGHSSCTKGVLTATVRFDEEEWTCHLMVTKEGEKEPRPKELAQVSALALAPLLDGI